MRLLRVLSRRKLRTTTLTITGRMRDGHIIADERATDERAAA